MHGCLMQFGHEKLTKFGILDWLISGKHFMMLGELQPLLMRKRVSEDMSSLSSKYKLKQNLIARQQKP